MNRTAPFTQGSLNLEGIVNASDVNFVDSFRFKGKEKEIFALSSKFLLRNCKKTLAYCKKSWYNENT